LAAFLGLPKVAPPDVAETAQEYAERLKTCWINGSREIVFHTSGSTGVPQACPHSEEMLRQETAETGALFQGIKRVLVAAPLLHSYGFIFGVMLPKTLGLPVLDVPPLPTILAETLRPGDLAVGFPLLFSRLETAGKRGLQFLTSTAPCPEALFQDILKRHVALTEIYGASETGAMAVRCAPGAFRLLSYWSQAGDGYLARRLPGGAEQNFSLPDNLHWQDERHFVPAGRRDLAVQVGGVNVYPARVAAVIREHPLVGDCAVRLMNPAEGFRLKAFIVPALEIAEPELRRDLQQYIKARLSPPERPGCLKFGPELPQSLHGKALDWAI
jgi:4-coumarate--CoA ligase (photoactive yellow protein activation family)